MSMLAKRASLPAVTAAAVVAIIFSLFGALGSLLVGVSLLLVPEMPATRGALPMPQGVRAMSAAMIFFVAALAVFGIFVAVGIFRRRNWARIAILVWGGFMTFVCVGAFAFTLVIFSAMPLPLPSTNAGDPGNFILFMKVFLAVFYGVPACVGIWWLVLFTRARVANAFTSPVPYTPAMDASGFPQLEGTTAPQQQRQPSCPLPLAIVAVMFMFSAVCTLMFVLVPSPYVFPYYFFGRISFGLEPKIVFAVIAVVLGIAGVGMLKLKPWALHTALAVQGIFFVNGLFAIVSPTFLADMREAMEKMSSQYSTFPGGNPFLSGTYFRSAMIFGLVFSAVLIALLAFLRSRFLEQAEAAAAIEGRRPGHLAG